MDIENDDSLPIDFLKRLNEVQSLFGENSDEYARELNRIGLDFNNQQAFAKAIKYLEKAQETYKKIHILGLDPDVAQILNNIGIIYCKQGELIKALQFHEEALGIQLIFYGEVHHEVAASLCNIGNIYSKLGELAIALQIFKKALEIFRQIHRKIHPDIAGILINIGIIYGDLKDFTKALQYFMIAFKMFIKIHGEVHPGVASTLNNIGIIYCKQGELAKALEHFKKELDILKNIHGEVHHEVARSLHNIGAVYKEYGDLAKALQYLEKVFEINKKIYDKGHLILVLNCKNLGLIYEELGHFKVALGYYENSMEILREITQNMEKTEDSFRIIGDYYYLFNRAISVINLNSFKSPLNEKVGKSFWTMERSKASQLLQLFQDLKAWRISGIPDEFIAKDSQIKNQIGQYQIKLDKAYTEDSDQNSEKMGRLKGQLRNLQEEHRRFIKEIEQKYPRYFDLKYETKTAEITDIQSVLDENEALLNYLLDTEKKIVYILYISQNNFDIKIAHSKNDLNGISNDFVACIKNLDLDGTLRNGSLLYDVLINPVINSLEEDKINKIIIIPDQILFNVPFEVLVPGRFFKGYNEATDGDKSVLEDNISYLIRNYAISYHFSATLFFNLRKEKDSKAATDSFIGFAPVFDDEFCRTFRLPDFLDGTDRIPDKLRSAMRGDRSIEPLPYTRDEISTASRMFDHHSGPILNQEATKEAFISRIKDHNIVMVGTHGYYHRQSPELSGMIFYPVKTEKTEDFNPESEVDPYILFIGETYNLPLQSTSLVILSCCETALGELKRGEGIIGLSRGFLYSGCSSVACSLWKINDEKTADLWKEFFSLYKKVSEPNYAILLQKAKIAMIEQGFEPFYWGAFVMIGRG